MPEIKTKQTFGGVRVAHISPPVTDAVPKSMNVNLTFEEALKLHFNLGQLLGKLNGYNRSTKAGRRACANLCLHTRKNRITVNEGRLKAKGAASAEPELPADATE